MADEIPEHREKTQPSQQPDVERELARYERLQLSAERQIDNIGKAYEVHSSLIKNGLLFFATLVSILVTLGGVFFFHSIQELKESARSKVQDQLEVMTNAIALKIEEEDNRVDTIINESFKRDNIEPLIETKVQGKVDEVTTNIIEEEINQRINPEFAGLTNQMADVETELNKAKISSEDVWGVLDLDMDIVMALNDDRNAFDKLHELAQSGTNIYQRAIVETIETISIQDLTDDSPFVEKSLNWTFFNINPDRDSFEAYINLFEKTPEPLAQSLILKKLSEQTRFPREKKLTVYRELLKTTTSLKVLSRTCTIINDESHLNLNILGVPQYLRWVDSQLWGLAISNRTESIRTNKNDVNSYLARSQAYLEETNFSAALNDCMTAIAIQPTNSDALNSCAWLLAVCPNDSIRDGKQAVKFATKACELTNWKAWECVGTLAAAFAEAGDFEQAIKYEKQAIHTDGISEAELEGESRRLNLFEQNKPTHEFPIQSDP